MLWSVKFDVQMFPTYVTSAWLANMFQKTHVNRDDEIKSIRASHILRYLELVDSSMAKHE